MRLDLLAPHDAVKPRHPVSKRGPSSAIICATTILTVEALALSKQIASSEYSNQTVPWKREAVFLICAEPITPLRTAASANRRRRPDFAAEIVFRHAFMFATRLATNAMRKSRTSLIRCARRNSVQSEVHLLVRGRQHDLLQVSHLPLPLLTGPNQKADAMNRATRT
jgi:hypothetical protein